MQRFLFGLKRAYHATLRVNQRVMEDFGVTPARFDLLCALRGGFMQQGELPGILGVSKPTVSRMLKALQGIGIVVRVRDPEDRRRKLVRLAAAAGEWMGDTSLDLMESVVLGDALDRIRGEAGRRSARRRQPKVRIRELEVAFWRVRSALGDVACLDRYWQDHWDRRRAVA